MVLVGAPEVPNKLMVLSNSGAAQSVLRPPCLLSGFAAHQHVVRVISALQHQLLRRYIFQL